MIKTCIILVAGIGVLGLIIGIFGEPTFLLGSCMLIGSALIAAAIEARNQK